MAGLAAIAPVMAGGGGDDGDGLAAPHAFACGARCDVNGVFQRGENAAVVFGRHNQHAVCLLDLRTQALVGRGRVGIAVLRVQRQVIDLGKGKLELAGVFCGDKFGDFAVERLLGKAADND